MASFLYYIPGGQARDFATAAVPREQIDARLAEAGIGYAFEGRLAATDCSTGPDNGGGCVLADPQRQAERQVRFRPDEQQWQPIPGAAAWLGWWTDGERPGPADLQRDQIVPGYQLPLGDGRSWTIPLACESVERDGQVTHEPALPRRYELTEAGEFRPGPIDPRYASLFELASRFWDAHDAAGGESFEFSDPEAALRILQHNYRIGRLELVTLNLLRVGGGEAARVLMWAADAPGFYEILQKKTASDAGDSSPGPEG